MDDSKTDPSAADADVHALYHGTLGVLADARQAMIALLAEAQAEKTVSLEDLLKSNKLVTTALDDAVKMEQRLHDWTHANHRNQGDDGIDLEAARNDIGCRLDRLRACCHSE